MNTTLSEKLSLERCPHCSVSLPNLGRVYREETKDCRGHNVRCWAGYLCANCGGIVFGWSPGGTDGIAWKIYPETTNLSDDIPDKAREYLSQAISSISTPAGAVMLSASAVDEMLKNSGYLDGNLNSRIEKAVKDNILTNDMGSWAHYIRLDANDQRHSDAAAQLPTTEDAERVVEFAKTLAQILFVLPARVKRGMRSVKGEK